MRLQGVVGKIPKSLDTKGTYQKFRNLPFLNCLIKTELTNTDVVHTSS